MSETVVLIPAAVAKGRHCFAAVPHYNKNVWLHSPHSFCYRMLYRRLSLEVPSIVGQVLFPVCGNVGISRNIPALEL